jgi:hypothetical protein
MGVLDLLALLLAEAFIAMVLNGVLGQTPKGVLAVVDGVEPGLEPADHVLLDLRVAACIIRMVEGLPYEMSMSMNLK